MESRRIINCSAKIDWFEEVGGERERQRQTDRQTVKQAETLKREHQANELQH